jgi:hypothetical protein
VFKDEYFETQWTILESMARSSTFKMISCILDGLDECEQTSLEVFLKKLIKLFPSVNDSESSSSQSSSLDTPIPCKLRIICISRQKHPGYLQFYLGRYEHINLSAAYRDMIEADVRTFVDTRIRKISKFAGWGKELRDQVKSRIASRAEGVYLWAAFVIDQLLDCEEIEITHPGRISK